MMGLYDRIFKNPKTTVAGLFVGGILGALEAIASGQINGKSVGIAAAGAALGAVLTDPKKKRKTIPKA